MAKLTAQLGWELSVVFSRWRNRARYVLAVPRVYRNWWVWPLPKLGVGVVLELRNGLRYRIRPGTTDLSVVNEAAILNPYLSRGCLQITEDAIIVDVGANIGDFAVQVAHLCPRGQVYAIEPISENVQMIMHNNRLNGLSNIRAVQLALGADEGELEIHLAGSASSAYFREQASTTENVRVTTLPRLMRELGIDHIDLLKLDCEGAEWDILRTCDEILHSIKQICIEFHQIPGWTAEKLAESLHKRDFEVLHTKGGWNGLLWAWRTETHVQ